MIVKVILSSAIERLVARIAPVVMLFMMSGLFISGAKELVAGSAIPMRLFVVVFKSSIAVVLITAVRHRDYWVVLRLNER